MSAWDPAHKDSFISLSEGNLVAMVTSTLWQSVVADTSKSFGKWYFEVKVTAGDSNVMAGWGSLDFGLNHYVGDNLLSWGWGHDQNIKAHNNQQYPHGTAPQVNDVIRVAWDADVGHIWFGLNDSWFGGDPATDTAPAFTNVFGTLFPTVSLFLNGNTVIADFSLLSFEYPSPAGFLSIEISSVADSGAAISCFEIFTP